MNSKKQEIEYRWDSIFRNSQGKVSAMEVGFLLWMISLSVCWGALSLWHMSLADLPSSVVHLTLAMGATKVSHRIADGNWEKVFHSIVEFLKGRFEARDERKKLKASRKDVAKVLAVKEENLD